MREAQPLERGRLKRTALQSGALWGIFLPSCEVAGQFPLLAGHLRHEPVERRALVRGVQLELKAGAERLPHLLEHDKVHGMAERLLRVGVWRGGRGQVPVERRGLVGHVRPRRVRLAKLPPLPRTVLHVGAEPLRHHAGQPLHKPMNSRGQCRGRISVKPFR